MFGFGDELIIHSNRIPWLIWVQILITFLLALAILASFFGLSVQDSSSGRLSSAVSCSFRTPSTYLAITQEPAPVERDQVYRNLEASVEVTTGSNRRTRVDNNSETDSSGSNRRTRVDSNSETGSSSLEDPSPKPVSERVYHPCGFLDLAKEAFLKCLGLGSPPKDQTHED